MVQWKQEREGLFLGNSILAQQGSYRNMAGRAALQVEVGWEVTGHFCHTSGVLSLQR